MILLCFCDAQKQAKVSQKHAKVSATNITGATIFRSLISRLGKVDPWKLNHEEKLAFWINVHNALVMHVRANNPTLHYVFTILILYKRQLRSARLCDSAGIPGLRGSTRKSKEGIYSPQGTLGDRGYSLNRVTI